MSSGGTVNPFKQHKALTVGPQYHMRKRKRDLRQAKSKGDRDATKNREHINPQSVVPAPDVRNGAV